MKTEKSNRAADGSTREAARARQNRYYQAHKAECRARSEAWQKAHPEKMAEFRRQSRQRRRESILAYKRQTYKTEVARGYAMKSKYGLTPEVYRAMLELQAGLCACCTKPMKPGHGTHVDHDHKTGKVRALVCNRCNNGFAFMDDSLFLADAATYLEVYGS